MGVLSTTARSLGLMIATLSLVTACASPGSPASSGTDSATASVSPPSSGTPCGGAPAIALEEPTPRSLSVGGQERQYRLNLPASYDASEPAPVILNLHGADESGSIQASVTELEPAAWALGYVVVHPEAISGLWMFEDATDIDYLVALLDEVAAEFCVDPERVFAAGMCQGGDFASFFACQVPGGFAAVASVAVLNFYEGCVDWTPTPLIAFAGTSDPIYRPDQGLSDAVPFSGDPEDKPGPLADEATAWATANGCEPVPTESPGDAGTASFSFACPGGAEVQYLIHAGGHTWPGGGAPPPGLGPAVPDLDANAIILDFFGEHSDS